MPQAPDKIPPREFKQIVGAPARLNNDYFLRSDEFVKELRGYRSHVAYREMRDNSSVVGGVMSAFEGLIRADKFKFEPADDTPQAKEMAELAQTFLDDMDGTFDDFLTNSVSYLAHGFSMFEKVSKIRGGKTNNINTRSKYDDGMYGYRLLAPRAQWTVYRWFTDPETEQVTGVQQNISGSYLNKTGLVQIPIEKLVVFRRAAPNGDPSGRSILRNAYRNWYYASRLEEFEAIGVQRNLNGIPVVRAPKEWMLEGADPSEAAFATKLLAVARDLQKNEQGAIMLPSDLIISDDKATSYREVDIELLAAPGTQDMHTDPIIQRHHKQIATAVLADFILLGQDAVGSYALSEGKQHLFLRSVQGVAETIADTIEKQVIKPLWDINNLDPDMMPKPSFDDMTDPSLKEIGEFVRAMSGAGMPMFPDVPVENSLRRLVGWEEVDEDRVLDDPDMRIGLGLDSPPIQIDPNKTPPDGDPGKPAETDEGK